MPQPHRDLVFISYCREDREWLGWLQVWLKHYTLNEGLEVWADPYIGAGARWRDEIRQSLDRAKVAVLLVSPDFLASDFIANEELPAILELADAGELVVICVPVSTAPRDRRLTAYQWPRPPGEPLDLLTKAERNQALDPIVSAIVDAAQPVVSPARRAPTRRMPYTTGTGIEPLAAEGSGRRRLGKLHRVPSQRPYFVARGRQLERLRSVLLAANRKTVGITGSAHPDKVGLQGMGGIGKTTLAVALTEGREIREAFPDGIFWLNVGRQRDLLRLQTRLAADLSGSEVTLEDLERGRDRLRDELRDRAALLILDDVWSVEQVAAFDVLGPRSRLLITTRDASIVTAVGACQQKLEVLSPRLALELLARRSGQDRADLPPEAELVAEQCGYLPLALSLVAARVREETPWQEVLDALRQGALEFFNHPSGSIFNSLKLGVDALSEAERSRYLELAVFAEGAQVPESTVETLWRGSAGLAELEARDLLHRLQTKGLLYLSRNDGERRVSLHDLQRDYLNLLIDNWPALHARLLDAYGSSLWGSPVDGRRAWHSLPEGAGYLWVHLGHHLIEAGKTREFLETLEDLRFIARKIFVVHPRAVEADLEVAMIIAPERTALADLYRNIARAAHLLIGPENETDLAVTLLSRLYHIGQLRRMRLGFERTLEHEYLRPAWILPDRPHPALLRVLKGPPERVIASAVEARGEWCVSGGAEGTLQLWDTASGECRRTIEAHGAAIKCCSVDPEGRVVVSGGRDGRLRVWDVESGEQRLELAGHTDVVAACAVDPTGMRIGSGSFDLTVRLWSLDSGELLHTLEGSTDLVNCCAFDPDGQWIVAGSDDRRLYLWAVETGELLRTLEGHEDWVTCCAVSPDGRRIVSGSKDRTLIVWDARTGARESTLEGHSGSVTACAVDSSGGWVLSGSEDQTVKLWGLDRGELRNTLDGHSDEVTTCSAATVGTTAVSGSKDQTLRIWSLAERGLTVPYSGAFDRIQCCAVDPRGSWIVTGSFDQTLTIWDAETSELVGTLEGHGYGVTCCAVEPGGRWIVSGSVDRSLRIWDRDSYEVLRVLRTEPPSRVTCCAVDPKGRWVVSGSEDAKLRLWDPETGEVISTMKGHLGVVRCCAIDPEGEWIVSGGDDKTLRIWDARSGEQRQILEEHLFRITSCAVEPESRRIVSGSADRTLRVWDASSSQSIATLHAASVVDCCAFAPQGGKLVTGTRDQTIRLWDVGEGDCEVRLRVDGQLQAAAWMPDGSRIAVGGRRGLYVFELAERGLA